MADDGRSEEERILTELRKSGYPTEIVSARVMQSRGWRIIHNPSYLDDVETINREYDIRAYMQWNADIDTVDYQIGVYLITECKKSAGNPWVFFTTEESHQQGIGRLIQCQYKSGINSRPLFEGNNPIFATDWFQDFHHYAKNVSSRARTFTEAFRSQNQDTGTIYKAAMSAIKATMFNSREGTYNNWLRIFYPVIVFSGHMYEAKVDSEGIVHLSKTDYVQLAQHYTAPPTGRKRDNGIGLPSEFIVDIVHDSYLPQYLAAVEEGHKYMSAYVGKALREDEFSPPSRSGL